MSFYDIPNMTDDEIENGHLLEKGEYDFVVFASERKESKAGNPMAKLQLQVWDKEGKPHIIYDYLVFSNIGLNIKKVKHFCESVGLTEEFKNRKLPEKLADYAGRLSLGRDEEKPNLQGGVYPAKNIVLDYLKRDGNKQIIKKDDDFINDDLPF